MQLQEELMRFALCIICYSPEELPGKIIARDSEGFKKDWDIADEDEKNEEPVSNCEQGYIM